MSLHILNAGFHTSIQDLGRFGQRQFGIGNGGAMDKYAVRVANILVGNPPDSPVLEIFNAPFSLFFEQKKLVSLVGFGAKAFLEGREIPFFTPFLAENFEKLTISPNKNAKKQSAWIYLSVAGGFEASHFLGSFSTNLILKKGGFEGRLLQKNDVLSVTPSSDFSKKIEHKIGERRVANFGFLGNNNCKSIEINVLRIAPSLETKDFDTLFLNSFPQKYFSVSPTSNRMGVRLLENSDKVFSPKNLKKSIISRPITEGSVQMTPEGLPIILTADCQTTGGYPVIGQVIAADLGRVGQLLPHQNIKFEWVDWAKAENLWVEQERELRIFERFYHLFITQK